MTNTEDSSQLMPLNANQLRLLTDLVGLDSVIWSALFPLEQHLAQSDIDRRWYMAMQAVNHSPQDFQSLLDRYYRDLCATPSEDHPALVATLWKLCLLSHDAPLPSNDDSSYSLLTALNRLNHPTEAISVTTLNQCITTILENNCGHLRTPPCPLYSHQKLWLRLQTPDPTWRITQQEATTQEAGIASQWYDVVPISDQETPFGPAPNGGYFATSPYHQGLPTSRSEENGGFNPWRCCFGSGR